MSWQPIETAPKDGTEFLAHYTFRGNSGYDLVSWVTDTETVMVEIGNGLFRREERDASEFIGNQGRFSGKYATHWQPLPPPPK